MPKEFHQSEGLAQHVEEPPLPTKAALHELVIAQRKRGVRPITVTTYLGAMNAFCAWPDQEGHVAERLKLPELRVERRLLPLLDDAQMRALIGVRRWAA